MGCRPAILIPFTLYKATRLNLFGLSEPMPIGLGVSVEKKGDPVADIGSACSSSSCLCHRRQRLCRAQGPHFAKALVGPRNQLFLPLAILISAWMLLVADTIGRNILEPKDIPAGIMIALIGAPYLMFLLMKSRRKSIIFVKAEDVFSFFCVCLIIFKSLAQRKLEHNISPNCEI
jgi:ABC-type enterobactin transport system permease subunit